MKHSLSIIYCTSRSNPELLWFLDSLCDQLENNENPQIIVVDGLENRSEPLDVRNYEIKIINPKPCVWSGPSRLTKDSWWSKSNALNSALCAARGEYIVTMDDRSVLMPGWLDGIRRQMDSPFPYVLCGSYQKRVSMTVEHGVIKNSGIIVGEDNRTKYCKDYYEIHGTKPPFKADKGWTYGVCVCLPLEWALNVNGFFEGCDGLSGEDYVFGSMLNAAGYPIYFDPRMVVVEDRTPELCCPVAIRRDKGVSPNDKSHKMLENIKGVSYAPNPFHIRELRKDIQSGKPWPSPSGADCDWYDGQKLSEMTPN